MTYPPSAANASLAESPSAANASLAESPSAANAPLAESPRAANAPLAESPSAPTIPDVQIKPTPSPCHCCVSSGDPRAANAPSAPTIPDVQIKPNPQQLLLLQQSFIADLKPDSPVRLFIVTRLAEIAHRQNRLSACEPHILQNEAIRQYENKLIHWRKQRQDHIARYGAFDKNHPAPQQPLPDEPTDSSLLAHAFSPTLQPENAPARKIPTLSPYERYLKTQQHLDTLFLRLLGSYHRLQNKPTSAANAPLAEPQSAPPPPAVQIKPNEMESQTPPLPKSDMQIKPNEMESQTPPLPKSDMQIKPTPS